MSGIDPDITIISKRKLDDRNRQLMTSMAAQWPMIQQDPNIPQVSKNIFFRKLLELQGIPRDEVLITIPRTPDEMRAIDYLELLNNHEVLRERKK